MHIWHLYWKTMFMKTLNTLCEVQQWFFRSWAFHFLFTFLSFSCVHWILSSTCKNHVWWEKIIQHQHVGDENLFCFWFCFVFSVCKMMMRHLWRSECVEMTHIVSVQIFWLYTVKSNLENISELVVIILVLGLLNLTGWVCVCRGHGNYHTSSVACVAHWHTGPLISVVTWNKSLLWIKFKGTFKS